MGARSVWKGHIKFNLVTVPIALYTAAHGAISGIYFNQLHKGCNQRIRQPKTCPVHGRVEPREIVSGYEYAEDQYVLIDRHCFFRRCGCRRPVLLRRVELLCHARGESR
jgi:DNA end-binding protein Ku